MTRLCCARTLAALAILAVTALGGVPAQAQSWPSKPVKIIMATAAGSAPDVIARIVTDRLSQMWGQQVLIINRPGAGGLIALQALAAAERDGHTLYLPSSSSLVVLPVTNANLPLSIERDLVPIALVGEQPFMIVANNTLGVSTLAEFIALAKSKPKELTYAANFRGSLPNMTGEWFRDRAGIDLTFVPYPGAPQGLQDVLGGRVSAMVEGLAAFVGPMASNSIKPLGVTSPKRLPNYPNLPTVAETVQGFDSRGWFVFMGARRHAGRRGEEDQCRRAFGAGRARGAAALRDAGHLRAPSLAGADRPVHPRRAGGVAAGGAKGRRDVAVRLTAAETKRAPKGAPLRFGSGDRLLAARDRNVVAPGRAGVELARTADALGRVLDHFLPLRDPADGARDREQHGEHAGREAHRLERDARIEVDVRVELLLDEILVAQRDALELHRDLQQRIVAVAESRSAPRARSSA